jgi:four helix bundle protein
MRAGSSVAANHRAARLAQSSASFIAKISIVIEESDECEFWCEIIYEEDLVNDPLLKIVHQEAKEVSSIFIATRKTMTSKKR